MILRKCRHHIVSRNWIVSAGQQYCLSEKIAQRDRADLVNKVWFDVLKVLLWLECSLISYFSFITHLSWLQTRRDELFSVQKNYLGFRTSWEPRKEPVILTYDDLFCCTTMHPKVDNPLWMYVDVSICQQNKGKFNRKRFIVSSRLICSSMIRKCWMRIFLFRPVRG